MSALLHIRPTLAWEEFPDEVVAIDLDRGIYFNLTGAGADVFRCFAVATDVAQVVDHLAGSFTAPPAEVLAAASQLVAELVKHTLLVPTGGAPATLPTFPEGARTLESLVLHRHDDLQNLLFLDPVHETADPGWPVRKP